MTALERVAREVGIAIAECGADDSSTLVGELAETLAALAREPSSRRGRPPGPRRGSRRRTTAGAAEPR